MIFKIDGYVRRGRILNNYLEPKSVAEHTPCRANQALPFCPCFSPLKRGFLVTKLKQYQKIKSHEINKRTCDIFSTVCKR